MAESAQAAASPATLTACSAIIRSSLVFTTRATALESAVVMRCALAAAFAGVRERFAGLYRALKPEFSKAAAAAQRG